MKQLFLIFLLLLSITSLAQLDNEHRNHYLTGLTLPVEKVATNFHTSQLLVEVQNPQPPDEVLSNSFLEDRTDTVTMTNDREQILKLLKYNNTITAWFNKKVQEEGDFMVLEMQKKIPHPQLHFFRLYIIDSTGKNTLVFYFAVDLSTEMAAYIAYPEYKEVNRLFTNTSQWKTAVIGQKHIIDPRTEKKPHMPEKSTLIFKECYFYCGALFPANEDPMMYPSHSIYEKNWNAFKQLFLETFPFMKMAPTDKEKAAYQRCSVHYLIVL